MVCVVSAGRALAVRQSPLAWFATGLSRWLPITEQWMRIVSYPSKTAAIEAAYGETPGS
jgi:hypothetical protein